MQIHNPRQSNILLLITAMIWGFAFVAQRQGMEHVQPFTFNGARFTVGAFSLLPIVFILRNKQSRPVQDMPSSASVLFAGCCMGAILFLGASFQQIGIVFTTAGKAGFITGLYVILVPILGLLLKQRTGVSTWIGACLAVVGMYFLSITDGLHIGRGDLLVLISAFFWAAHVLLISSFTKRFDVLLLALYQFLFCALLSWLAALQWETISTTALLAALAPILYTGILSVGIAYTLQIVAQKHAHPAHAAIILSLESVFAVLGGWLFLGEVLSLRGLLGCGLMLTGMIFSQLFTADPITQIANKESS